ncbi:MAG: nucleotide exchange factor GrpE [Bacteroidales bacterium]|nr:nucleotide exchange factor GrpE [Bacteroidales bacterium]
MAKKNKVKEEEAERQYPGQETGKESNKKKEQEDKTKEETAGKEETKSKKHKAKEDTAEDQEKKPDSTDEKENSTEAKLAEFQDRYLRLSAEFDNYRKRTLKERMELTKSAGESLLVNLLPVMDDFDRAIQLMESSADVKGMQEGLKLIYGKMKDFLKQNGIKEIDALNKEFDTDLHEAVTKIPAPEEKMKGKVVDVVQKGYYLNDKIIRYSKVVVGE